MTDIFSIHNAQDIVEQLMAGKPVGNLRLNELLYLLDELEQLHSFLDKHEVPAESLQGLEMTLQERLNCLFIYSLNPKQTAEPKHDFYGKPLPVELKQLPLFKSLPS